MNNLLLAGTVVVSLTLILYSIAVITQQRTGKVNMLVVFSITTGILFDISARLLMIMGAPGEPLTLQGVLGYTALAAMAVSVILIWRIFRRRRKEVTMEVPRNLHLYIRYAYIWWVLTYLFAILLAIIN